MAAEGEPSKASGAFRSMLRTEVRAWTEEGLITPEQGARLAERYRFGDLGRDAGRLLSGVIFTIGALLIGGGIMAFVAAHWEAIPKSAKIAMLFAAVLGFHVAGWLVAERRHSPRLGRALIFTGCLAFGASIGLLAQIFQIHSDWYRGFGAWALGCVAMAWALRSASIGLLALALSMTWFSAWTWDTHSPGALFALVVLVVFIPLALLADSRALHALTLIIVVAATAIATGNEAREPGPVMLALTVTGLLGWSLGRFYSTNARFERFAPSSLFVGALALAGTAYAWSFAGMADDSGVWQPMGWHWMVVVAVMGTVALAALVTSWKRRRPSWPGDGATLGFMGAGIGLVVVALMLTIVPTEFSVFGMLACNLLALVIAASAIASGFADERRSHFWLGTLFAVGLVVTRFLEYETSLLAKSAVFIALGVGVLLAGIRYERFLRDREGAHE